MPAAERSGLGAGEQPRRAPGDALPVPRAKGGSGRRQEAFPRARAPCCDFAGRSAATQQEIVLPRLGGQAGGAEPRRAVPGLLPASGPPSWLGGSRGTRANTALHGRGTGDREQPLAPGWKMRGRNPQPSMELNSECVAKRGDWVCRKGQWILWPHSQSVPCTMNATDGHQTQGCLWAKTGPGHCQQEGNQASLHAHPR